MNPLFDYSLAEFAWEKVRFAKRVLGKHSPREALPLAWYYGLILLIPTQHVPESVRDDFKAFSQFMCTELVGGQRFCEATSDFEIEQAASAFWRVYDAVSLWYLRLNEQLNECLTQ